MPIPPQKSKSSFDLLSLHFDSGSNNAKSVLPVLSTPSVTSAPPMTRPNILTTTHQASMLNVSLSSPTKSLPRTNPYFQPPKSPKTEFGPFQSSTTTTSAALVKPPPIPVNSPGRPFQSTLNLSTTDSSKHFPPKPKSPPPRPPPLSKSLSHQSLPSTISEQNKRVDLQNKSFNPFLNSKTSSSLPTVSKTWTNPFRAPLSSFAPEDPSDQSRLLGIQLFTELLASSNRTIMASSNNTLVDNSNITNNRVRSVNTNPVADPLTNPPPSATLPPMNRKPSSGTAAPIGQSAPAAANQSQPALAQSSTQDRYSALAELDDLFRSTAIESPVVAASPAAPALGQQPDLAGLFSSGAKPAPVHSILVSDPSGQPHNGSPGWAAAAPPAPWGQSVSPAAGAWNSAGRSASPAAASGWAGNSNNTSSAAWNSAGRSASPAAAGWAWAQARRSPGWGWGWGWG